MADNNIDPAASTQMFRAYVDDGDTAGSGRARTQRRRTGLIAAAALAVVVIGVVAWLLTS